MNSSKSISLYIEKSITRSQKRRNTQQEAVENVSEGFVSPVVVGISSPLDQEINVAGPSKAKSPMIKSSVLENLRASMKEEIPSEIKNLLVESQKEMLRLLKPETKENGRENVEEETESETRSFYTPTKSVRINSTQNNDTNVSRNMVKGVLTDSTNHPKRPEIRSQSQPASQERHAVARTLFGAERNDNPAVPMPKALTASPSTFDGKTEKFELFEDLFRDIKMYPHLTELQKINYFHSLLHEDALQAFCNIEDAKKDSLEGILTLFKRRFGDYLSMAKARCDHDALRFDPSTQKLHEFLDVLQKTAEEAFGSEAQQFIDKAIYAKMPDHVKKILNRAYLEDKPYNDIVLHPEREMRLNGLGAPDEVNLVTLNKIEPAQTKPEPKPIENPTQYTTQNTKKGYCFYCNKFGHFKAECRKLRKDKWQQTRKNNGQTKNSASTMLKCDTCGKPHKTEDCWNGANSANDPRLKRHFQQ